MSAASRGSLLQVKENLIRVDYYSEQDLDPV